MHRTRDEYQRRFGLDHAGLPAAIGDQALAWYEAGKPDEAEELYRTIIGPIMDNVINPQLRSFRRVGALSVLSP